MNANLLRSKIMEKGYSNIEFAELIGIKKTALYRKLKGITEFKASEIQKISKALNLTNSQIIDIFFVQNVS